MSYRDFLAKIRYLDNLTAKWILRHFYLLFFEFVLVLIFLGLFINTIKILDITEIINSNNALERLLLTNSYNTLLILLLMLLNSFWLLYMFHGIVLLRSILKDINFNIIRLRDYNKKKASDES